jgi:guanine deaminase
MEVVSAPLSSLSTSLITAL